MTIEERRYTASAVRADGGAKQQTHIAGYAARFNTLSEDLGGFRERLQPGCFRASLARGHDIKMLYGHNAQSILGSTFAQTLGLREDNQGLAFRCQLPDTATGREVAELCRRGDLRECSFGFRCEDEDWNDEEDPDDVRSRRKIPVRTVLRAHVLEVSAVAFPAYPQTSVGIDAPPMALAASARSLWPSGAIPFEIRSRVQITPSSRSMTDAERAIYAAALRIETFSKL
jgi:HK97 family phage prohead protease